MLREVTYAVFLTLTSSTSQCSFKNESAHVTIRNPKQYVFWEPDSIVAHHVYAIDVAPSTLCTRAMTLTFKSHIALNPLSKALQRIDPHIQTEARHSAKMFEKRPTLHIPTSHRLLELQLQFRKTTY